jgi:hypothetical protein
MILRSLENLFDAYGSTSVVILESNSSFWRDLAKSTIFLNLTKLGSSSNSSICNMFACTTGEVKVEMVTHFRLRSLYEQH